MATKNQKSRQFRPVLKEDVGGSFGKLLTDSTPVVLSLIEDSQGSGKVRVRGEFGRAGIATENKRVYPKKIWEREFNRLEKQMQERQVFGELDHPSDGRTSLNRTSHVITNLQLTDENLVIGEAEVLDTERGKNLQALLKAGCKVGVSSRGYGSTKANEKGEEVVQEDYRLVTFDFVAEPADTTAVPDVFFEEKGHMPNDDVEKKVAAAIEAERARLKEEFAREIISALGKAKTEMREQVRGELLSDPSVAAAKGVLDQMKTFLRPYLLPEDTESVVKGKDGEISRLKNQIAERDLKIKAQEDELEKLAETAKQVGYSFFVEREIQGDPNGGLIKKLVGDVKRYASSTEVKAKIESIRADLKKRAEEQKKADDAKQKLLARTQQEARANQAEANQLKEALRKALQSEKAIALKLYVERRLTNHPKAAKIRAMVESANPSTKEGVDKILQSYREPARDPEALESVRSRVRSMTRGGESTTPLEEEAPSESAKGGDNYNGLGMSLTDLKELSGIRRA
jgi:Prohead core protein serine protease